MEISRNDSSKIQLRTSEKVYKEFMLYAIGQNMNKYHHFLHEEIKKFEEKPRKDGKNVHVQKCSYGCFAPKIYTEKRTIRSLTEYQV